MTELHDQTVASAAAPGPSPCKLPEYERASAQFHWDLFHNLLASQHPLLARFHRVLVDEIPENPPFGQGLVRPLEAAPVFMIAPQALIEVDLTAWASMMRNAVRNALATIMPQIYANMASMMREAGQVTDGQAQPFSIDVFIQALEKIELDFNDDGVPKLPTMRPLPGQNWPGRVQALAVDGCSDQTVQGTSLRERGSPSMLGVAFESWISRLSEREFDGSFLSLLRAHGFYDVHFTHGAYEFGKDFVAKRNEPTPVQYAFQSKAGGGDGAAWNKLSGQLIELAGEKLAHVSFDAALPRKLVLVTTGRPRWQSHARVPSDFVLSMLNTVAELLGLRTLRFFESSHLARSAFRLHHRTLSCPLWAWWRPVQPTNAPWRRPCPVSLPPPPSQSLAPGAP